MYKDYIYSSQYRHKHSVATWSFQSQGTLNINAAAPGTQRHISAEPDGVILLYVLKYNMLCFRKRNDPRLQACFFQNTSLHIIIIYTVINFN